MHHISKPTSVSFCAGRAGPSGVGAPRRLPMPTSISGSLPTGEHPPSTAVAVGNEAGPIAHHGRTRMSKWIVRSVALVAVTVMLLSACGGGRSSSDGESSDTTKTGTDSTVPQFGDLASPCGPGTPSGSPDQAVDATCVTIGYGDDAGYRATRARPRGERRHEGHHRLVQPAGRRQRPHVEGNYYDAKITEMPTSWPRRAARSSCSSARDSALPAAPVSRPARVRPPIGARVVGGCGARERRRWWWRPHPQPIDYTNVEGPPPRSPTPSRRR